LFNKVIWADLPRVANPPATLSARGTREDFYGAALRGESTFILHSASGFDYFYYALG
jgi:hypothetical protein